MFRDSVQSRNFAGCPFYDIGLYSDTGAASRNDPSCRMVSAGELFYAYNFPEQHSSNTGVLLIPKTNTAPQ